MSRAKQQRGERVEFAILTEDVVAETPAVFAGKEQLERFLRTCARVLPADTDAAIVRDGAVCVGVDNAAGTLPSLLRMRIDAFRAFEVGRVDCQMQNRQRMAFVQRIGKRHNVAEPLVRFERRRTKHRGFGNAERPAANRRMCGRHGAVGGIVDRAGRGERDDHAARPVIDARSLVRNRRVGGL